MKLSTNTRYAIRVLFELAQENSPISIAALSEQTGISLRTVENIHTVLKQHEITTSIIGAKGGLKLIVSLTEISLGQIVTLFDEGVQFAVCFGNKSNDCPRQNICDTRSVWRTISMQIQKELNAVSLDSVLKQYREDQNAPKTIMIKCFNR